MKFFSIIGQWAFLLLIAVFGATLIRAIFVMSDWLFGELGAVAFLSMILIVASIAGARNAK